MLQDLHSHTYYSFCGADKPEETVEAAIDAGLSLFGICDHNYGIMYNSGSFFGLPAEMEILPDCDRTLRRYYDHINLIREKYKDRITVLRGIEICTLTGHGRYALPDAADVSYFDYCLIETLDNPANSIAHGDLFSFAERCGCKAGIAHTDMFRFIRSIGEDPYAYFVKMRERGIFWEMNISHDSIHRYREHPYMLEFFADEEQQDIVRRSGVEISIGFDGHRVAEYPGDRVRDYCRRAEALGLRFAFEKMI
ncbi:MAG: PHP domain-containing protein [Clostridia bacterium]|nr:PHP domain-containing protein [Clostridia bacterium]